MTDTEKALQAAIDRDPTDWLARGALADYLEEIGDERAVGWRALNATGRVPWHWTGSKDKGWWTDPTNSSSFLKELTRSRSVLPYDWFDLLSSKETQTFYERDLIAWPQSLGWWRPLNEAALAFARLPPDRQSELLSAPCSGG